MSGKDNVSLGVIDKPGGTGKHVILLYDDEPTLIDAFSSYYAKGVMDGDRCILTFFANGFDKKLKSEIKKRHGVDDCAIEKLFTSVFFRDAYFTGNDFDMKKVFGIVESEISRLASCQMLRAGGEMGWVSTENFEDVCCYEKSLTERYGAENTLIMCAYDSRKLKLSQMIQMIQSHVLILFREGKTWKVSETVERELYEKKINELEDFKNLAVGRELKMIELKKEIEHLKEDIPKTEL